MIIARGGVHDGHAHQVTLNFNIKWNQLSHIHFIDVIVADNSAITANNNCFTSLSTIRENIFVRSLQIKQLMVNIHW